MMTGEVSDDVCSKLTTPALDKRTKAGALLRYARREGEVHVDGTDSRGSLSLNFFLEMFEPVEDHQATTETHGGNSDHALPLVLTVLPHAPPH
ncbi:hypothetical protein E2C01_030730 [Portunus trituberculatus]|uniref:Uncharacterized protein n=1 Tax=Portunus trituberculatus TaxID=210409 RepID=A0A5B7EVN9_PORTR|nr:hypothetical protein [Portunus trituberculatus]